MALKPCKECGTEISSSATACPKCGAPIKKAGGCATAAVVLVGLIIVLGVATNLTDDGSPAPAAKPRVKTGHSPELQGQREKLLTELRDLGIIGRIDCRDRVADAWIEPAFYALDFDSKQKFSSVVYAYCFGTSEENAVVTLRDNRTGKEAGEFSALRGLRME